MRACLSVAGARQSDALALPAAEVDPFLADLRGITCVAK